MYSDNMANFALMMQGRTQQKSQQKPIPTAQSHPLQNGAPPRLSQQAHHSAGYQASENHRSGRPTHAHHQHPMSTNAAQRHSPADPPTRTNSRSRGNNSPRRSKGKSRSSSSETIPQSLLQLIPKKYHGVHAMGSTPEEIARWRAARRRNYPTAKTVEEKLKKQQDLQSAGSISIDAKSSSRPSPHEKLAAVAVSKSASKPATIAQPDNSEQNLPPSSSLSGLMAYGDSDSDSEDDTAKEAVTTLATEVPKSDSSAETESDAKSAKSAPESQRAQSKATRAPQRKSKKRQRVCDFFLRGNCTRGEKCNFAHDPDARVEMLKKKRIAVLRKEKVRAVVRNGSRSTASHHHPTFARKLPMSDDQTAKFTVQVS